MKAATRRPGDRPGLPAIALGTYSGGWRIIKTTGTKIIKMDSAQGFSAQAGAAVIMASSHFWLAFDHSRDQRRGNGCRSGETAFRGALGVAGNIVGARVLTLPVAAAIGALAYGITVLGRRRRRRAGGDLGPSLAA